MMIRIEGVSWKAGEFGLEDVSCEVPGGKYSVMMGRTGCGKTTLIELICGLRRPSSGRIFIGDRDVTYDPPGERGIGYVPQDGALFPAMTVGAQIGFAMRLRGRPAEEIDGVIQRLSAELGIEALLERKPAGLSGGEKQRVALGRALASEPKVMLLDEPLAALDERTWSEMIDLLKRTQREHGLTVLHVTHSRREAELLGECVFRLEGGEVGEIGDL